MPEAKRFYRIIDVDLNEINSVFAQISDRLDEIQGSRGRAIVDPESVRVYARDASSTILHGMGDVV